MLAEPEHYKGILYVRISALPAAERELVQKIFDKSMIVNILRENALLNDCILYPDYIKWFKNMDKPILDKPVEALRDKEEFILARIVN